MKLEHPSTRRGTTWLAVLLTFVMLLLLANQFTDGERFYGISSTVVIAAALLGLLIVYRATAQSDLWRVQRRDIALMAVGATLYALLSYLLNDVVDFSIGPVALRLEICIPILLGYALTPVVGFFAGAVGSLMGDFVLGWGVFPAWHIGRGLMGMVPGLATLVSHERRSLRYLSALVIVLMGLTVAIVFIHPRAPEPWTGEVRSFSLWGWVLIVGILVMLANSYLLERVSVALAAVNLWGTLGIILGNGFTSLSHVWTQEYGLATALIGEFAPTVAVDVLSLMIFAPLVLAGYSAVQTHGR